jgi:hypothetical protein
VEKAIEKARGAALDGWNAEDQSARNQLFLQQLILARVRGHSPSQRRASPCSQQTIAEYFASVGL